MRIPPYLPHLLYSTALTSISIHLLWQRNQATEDRARHDARVTILEDLAQQLRSGAPISDEEIDRLKNLAQRHAQGELLTHHSGETGWSEVVWGKKSIPEGGKK